MSSSLHNTKLEFDQKKNVFVTQLGEPDEEDYNVRKFPIVEESEWALVKDGTRTLQSTLLLQKQQEMAVVDQELESKRREFAIRMERCMNKQNELRVEQQKIKERVEKFDRFVRENEVKRQRALVKFQNERKQQEIREQELAQLQEKYQKLEKRQTKLINKIEDNRKFERYIQQVVDILPEGYLELSDNMMKGVISRYNTLEQANASLLHELMQKDDSIDKAQQDLAELNKSKTDEVLGYNSTIAALHSKLEKCYQMTHKKEEKTVRQRIHHRNQCQLYGQLELAIKNIVDMKCRAVKLKPGQPPHSLLEQLSIIEAYLLERESVFKMSQEAITPASSPGPAYFNYS